MAIFHYKQWKFSLTRCPVISLHKWELSCELYLKFIVNHKFLCQSYWISGEINIVIFFLHTWHISLFTLAVFPRRSRSKRKVLNYPVLESMSIQKHVLSWLSSDFPLPALHQKSFWGSRRNSRDHSDLETGLGMGERGNCSPQVQVHFSAY